MHLRGATYEIFLAKTPSVFIIDKDILSSKIKLCRHCKLRNPIMNNVLFCLLEKQGFALSSPCADNHNVLLCLPKKAGLYLI